MHDHDMEAEISPIRVRNVNQVKKAAKQLFQVVKDHNNPTIQEMLDVSNVYCYRHADDSSDDDSDDEINPSRFPMVPFILVVVNEREFGDILDRACNKIRSDGLVLVIDASRDQSSAAAAETTGNEVAVLIKKRLPRQWNYAVTRFNLSFPGVCKARWCDLYICSHDGCEQLSPQIACQRLFERRCDEAFSVASKIPCSSSM